MPCLLPGAGAGQIAVESFLRIGKEDGDPSLAVGLHDIANTRPPVVVRRILEPVRISNAGYFEQGDGTADRGIQIGSFADSAIQRDRGFLDGGDPPPLRLEPASKAVGVLVREIPRPAAG